MTSDRATSYHVRVSTRDLSKVFYVSAEDLHSAIAQACELFEVATGQPYNSSTDRIEARSLSSMTKETDRLDNNGKGS